MIGREKVKSGAGTGTRRRVGLSCHTDDTVDLSAGVSGAGVGVLMILAAAIGLWGLLCLASGLKVCGGVSALAANWLASILGG